MISSWLIYTVWYIELSQAAIFFWSFGIKFFFLIIRYSHKAKKTLDVDQPHLLKLYNNNNMGGVDLLDNLISSYSIRSRNRKWYWGVYNWFLNANMVQAWRFYKKIGTIMKEGLMEEGLGDFTKKLEPS